MWEVFTIGGADYLMTIFNAVAVWSGGGGFRSLISVVMVLGLTYALITMAMHLDWKVLWNWFIAATLIYMALLVPTTTVKITDRTDAAAGGTVDNVPIGLAAFASLSSTAGDWMTRTAETLFAMPGSLNLSSNGMIYGSRLLDHVYDYEFSDPIIYANLEEYNKQCLFYDILLHPELAKKIINSTDVLSDMGPGSEARAMKFMYHSGGAVSQDIRRCSNAYTAIVAQIAGNKDEAEEKAGKRFFPRLTKAAAKAKLEADLPVLHDAVFGTSGSSAPVILRQKAMVDSFARALNSFGNPELDALAAERANVQASNTYTAITSQAMTWVPMLNIILNIVFYAMFPVIFPLFLFPNTGVQTLKSYITGFFYLSAWGPLYAVLHMVVQTKLGVDMQGTAPDGIAPATIHAIKSVNMDLANLAGFLMMSIPFIAAGMARGAMAISGHAMSMLSPAQRAAEDAASERTTGNYAYGNRSFSNFSANNVQSSQWQMSPNYDFGETRASYRDGDGLKQIDFTGAGKSATTWDSGERMGRLPISFSSGFNAFQKMEVMSQQAASERQSALSQWSARHSSGERAASAHTQGATNVSGRTASNDRTDAESRSAGTAYAHQVTEGAARDVSGTVTERSDASKYAATDNSATKSSDIATTQGVRASLGIGGGKDEGEGKPASGAQGATGGKPQAAAKPTKGKGGLVGAAMDMLGIKGDATAYAELRQNQTTSAAHVKSDGSRLTNSDVVSNDVRDSRDFRQGHTITPYKEDRTRTSGQTDSDGRFARSQVEDGHSNTDERYTADELAMMRQYAHSRDLESRLSQMRGMGSEERTAFSQDLTAHIAQEYMRRKSEQKPWLPDIRDPVLSGQASQVRDKEINDIAMGLMSDRGSLSTQFENPFHKENGEYDYERIAGAMDADIQQMRRGIGEPLASIPRNDIAAPTRPEDLPAGLAPTPHGVAGAPLGGPVNVVLPRQGQGFRSYSMSGNQFSTAGVVGELEASSRVWAARGGAPVNIGDISKAGGGDMPGHATHENGRNIDIRPFRSDRQNAPVSWKSDEYDRNATREYIQMMRERNPQMRVLFNDPVLIREGLTQRGDKAGAPQRHDNHLHLIL
jgi:conjugal transfer mating pair stabilization protein TraG